MADNEQSKSGQGGQGGNKGNQGESEDEDDNYLFDTATVSNYKPIW